MASLNLLSRLSVTIFLPWKKKILQHTKRGGMGGGEGIWSFFINQIMFDRTSIIERYTFF